MFADDRKDDILRQVIKMTDKKQEMLMLVEKLNEAARAYYATDEEIMTNREYDQLYERLEVLEKEIGMILSNSPTQRVGYEVVSELPKVAHSTPMLSLDKTKDPLVLRTWLNQHSGVLSWKLDGLTVVLTYRDGKLFQAVTRGNGEVGEEITNNARVFANIPLHIPYEDELVVRGEAIITYQDFARINAAIEHESEKYKNPRNLCSGSVRQLNNRITKERHVRFVAFSLVAAAEDFANSRMVSFDWLASLGFEVVAHQLVTPNNIAVTNGDKKQSGKFSAATEYQIDTKKKTIKQVWSYGKNLGKQNFTEVIGYAQRLNNGNTLINFGFKNKGKESNIIEVDAYGNQVFNLTITNSAKDMTYVYRAYRMQFYSDNYVFDATK